MFLRLNVPVTYFGRVFLKRTLNEEVAWNCLTVFLTQRFLMLSYFDSNVFLYTFSSTTRLSGRECWHSVHFALAISSFHSRLVRHQSFFRSTLKTDPFLKSLIPPQISADSWYPTGMHSRNTAARLCRSAFLLKFHYFKFDIFLSFLASCGARLLYVVCEKKVWQYFVHKYNSHSYCRFIFGTDH